MATAAVRTQLTIVCIILFMARITIFRCAFEHAIDMTTFAGNTQMFSNQREGKFGMIDIDLIPAIGCVAGGAIGPKLTAVLVILLMTRETIRWRTIQNAVDVTLLALNADVQTGQLEGSQIMIEVSWLPTKRRVT